jgi:hypothetical protein
MEGREMVAVRVSVDEYWSNGFYDLHEDGSSSSMPLSLLTITEPGTYQGRRIQIFHACTPKADSLWLSIGEEVLMHTFKYLLDSLPHSGGGGTYNGLRFSLEKTE